MLNVEEIRHPSYIGTTKLITVNYKTFLIPDYASEQRNHNIYEAGITKVLNGINY